MAQLSGGRVTWTIDADNKAFKNTLADSEAAAQSSASTISKIGTNLSNSIGNSFSSIGRAAAQTLTSGAAAATTAVIALGVKGITSANQLQSLQLQMNGLTHSLDLGAQAMAGAFKYAQSSPFQLPDVAATTKTLIAFGITTQDAIKDLNTLGNVSITTGIPLQSIGGIFGQVSAQGKLMLGDIRQLTQDGIAILPALQKEFGKTADQVQDMATRGEISFDQFKVALDSLVDPTILDQLQNTLPRQLDRLGGSLRILSNAFVGVGVDATNGFTQASNGIAAAAVVLVKTLADALRSPEITTAATTLGNFLVPLLQTVTGNIDSLVNGVSFLAAQFTKLGSYAIPVLAIIVTGIGTLGSEIPVIGEYLKIFSSPLIVIGSLITTLAIKSSDFRNALEQGFALLQTTLTQLAPTFSTLAGIFNRFVQSLGTALAPVVDRLAVAFGNILIALAPIVPVLANFIASLVTALLPILPPLIDAFGTIAFTLLNALAPVLPELSKAIIDLVNAIVPLVPQLAEMGVIFIKAIIPVLPQLVNAFALLVQVLVPLLPLIVPLLPAFLALKGISAVTGAITGASDALQIFGLNLSLLKLGLKDGKGFAGLLSGLGDITGITKFGAAISGLVGIVGTVMGSIVSIIGTAAGAIGSAIFAIPVVGWILLAITALVGLFTYFYTQSTDFRNFVNGVFAGVAGFITDSFKSVGAFFNGVFSTINDAVVNTGKFFSDVFGTIGNIVSTTVGVIAAIVTPFVNVFNGIIYVLQALGTIVFTVFSAVGQIIFSVVSTIVQIIGVVLYGTFLFLYNNAVLPVFNGMVTIITNAFNAIALVFTTVWSGIVAFFTPILQSIFDAVNAIFTGISTVVINTFNGIVAFVTPIVNGFVGFLNGAFNGLAAFINGVFNLINQYIVNPIAGAINYVRANVGGIVGAVSGALSGALGAIGGFVNQFLAAGKNVIDGLVNGVKNGASSVVNTVNNIMKGALDAVKNFFGIHSPSTVMQDMGSYIMQGLQKGIEGSTGGVIDAANSASQGIAGALGGVNANTNLTGDFSVAGGLAPTAYSAGNDAGNAASASKSSVTIQQYNTVNTPVDMDKIVKDLTWELTRA